MKLKKLNQHIYYLVAIGCFFTQCKKIKTNILDSNNTGVIVEYAGKVIYLQEEYNIVEDGTECKTGKGLDLSKLKITRLYDNKVVDNKELKQNQENQNLWTFTIKAPKGEEKTYKLTYTYNNVRIGNFIYTYEDLVKVQEDRTGIYELCNDLDLTGIAFAPLFDDEPFQGEFYGNSYTIKNLNIAVNGDEYHNPSFFGGLASAKIVGLHFNKVSITKIDGNYLNVGVLAGYAENNTSVEDCHISEANINFEKHDNIGGMIGKVSNSSLQKVSIKNSNIKGAQNIAGLVGYAERLNMNDATAENIEITSGNAGSDVGGLLGGTEELKLNRSFVKNAKITGNDWVGGLIGYADNAKIELCYAVEVKLNDNGVVPDMYLGGLIGELIDSSIKNCYATGQINGVDADNQLGGFIGHASLNNKIESCYANVRVIAVQGTTNAGGFIGYKYDQANESTIEYAYFNSQENDNGYGTAVDITKQSTLFTGFDPSIWTHIAYQFPLLAWQ